MRVSKTLLPGFVLAGLAGLVAVAQQPVGVSGLMGHFLDYYVLAGGGPAGDTYYFTAWASNAMLPFFPDPAGLPILGTANDGNAGACSGDVMLLQLSKLPSPTTTPTTSNTKITNLTNCLTNIQNHGLTVGWTGNYTTGDAASDATWKGANMAFRNNRLLIPIYRQDNAGTQWGDSTMLMSPDAGQTYVDYGRWNSNSVTGATWSAGVATLTTANTYSVNQKIFVHDVVPSAYNGRATITAATAGTVQYALAANPGAYVSGGAIGPLDPNGSGPLGPANGGYNTMWRKVSGSNPMAWQMIINYGQDGSYPEGIEAACDPAAYVCGLATNKSLYGRPVVLFRFPVDHEMDKSSYQWYSCATYVSQWPTVNGVCDGNLAGSWTGTLANATAVAFEGTNQGGIRPANFFTVRYLSSHHSYVLSCAAFNGSSDFRFSYFWAPHPWGPWYPLNNGRTPGNPVTSWPGFHSLMGYGESVVSSTPPKTQVIISGNVSPGASGHPSGGSPYFNAVEFGPGRVPALGMARRGHFLDFGQFNMGHRFVSGNMAGGISRRGPALSGGQYNLDWWVDFWDHGGDTKDTTKTDFLDLISGGARSIGAWNDFAYSSYNFGATTLAADGIGLFGPGHNARLQSNFNDTVLSANGGNASWTFVGVFKITAAPGPGGVQNGSGHAVPIFGYGTEAAMTSMAIMVGSTPGDVFVCPTGSYNTATSCVYWNGTPVVANTWQFLAVTAQANATGLPTITMYLGSGGSIQEVGGQSLATAASGTILAGLKKSCVAGHCSDTPAITSQQYKLGYNSTLSGGASMQESMNGIFGEAAMYSGAVPGHVIREIYKSVRTDWARVGRGAL